jgi:hypothetical protein
MQLRCKGNNAIGERLLLRYQNAHARNSLPPTDTVYLPDLRAWSRVLHMRQVGHARKTEFYNISFAFCVLVVGRERREATLF